MLKRLRWVFGVGLLGALLSQAAFAADMTSVIAVDADESGSTTEDNGGTTPATITLAGDKEISASDQGAATYTVNDGDTLEIGDFALTVNGEDAHEATLAIESGGEAAIDGNGEINLTHENSILDNSGTIANDGLIDNAAGWIINAGTIDNAGTIENADAISNEGDLNNTGDVNNAGAIVNEGTITNTGGSITIAGSGDLENAGDIVNAGTIANEGIITNTGGAIDNSAGTLSFSAASSYVSAGGSIVNAFDVGGGGETIGVIELDTGMTGFDAAIADLSADMGKVDITGELKSNLEKDADSGTVTLGSAQGTSTSAMGYDIDIGDADLVLDGGGYFGGAITAKTTTVESVTTFQGVVKTDLIVDEDATLDTGSDFNGGGITIADGKTLFNHSNNTTIADGKSLTLNGNGGLDNYGTFTFADGAMFVSDPDGVIVNTDATLKFHSDISNGTGNAVQDIFDALGKTDIGTVEITGVLVEDLASEAIGGTINLVSRQGTSSSERMSENIDTGGADLSLSAGGHLDGEVKAETITTGDTTVFYSTVDGNLAVKADTTLTNGSAFAGKDITIDSGKKLTSERAVIMSAGKTLSNSGIFDNKNVLAFDSGSTYSGLGFVNNKNDGASAKLDAGMTGLNDVLNAMVGGNAAKDIGKVTITGAPTEEIAATALFGDVTLESDGATTYTTAINLGGSDITVADASGVTTNVKTFNAVVTANSITTNAVSIFYAAPDADLIVNEYTTLASGSLFSGHDITIAAGETLDNDSQSTTISAGNILSNAGIFDNAGGTLTLASGSTYTSVGGTGQVLNAGGTAKVNTAMTGFAAFVDDLDFTDLGNVNVAGQLTSALDKSDALDGIVTIEDRQTGAAKIDIGIADLILAQGGVFADTVAADNIDVKAASTFRKAVTASDQLLVNGESTFQDTVAAANGVTTNSKAIFMKDVAADALVNADTTFNGSVEDVEVTATGHARIGINGDFLSLSNSGETSLAIGNLNFTDQFNEIANRTDDAVVNVIADANGNRITGALRNTSGRGVFNFGGSGNNVLSIEEQINVAGGAYHASQGTTQLNVTDSAVHPAIIADSFTVDSGATFVYDYDRDGGSGTAVIQSDANTVERNATLRVAADDTLVFSNSAGTGLSALTLDSGSKVVLTHNGTNSSTIKASAVDGGAKVTLDLNGGTLDWLYSGLGDSFLDANGYTADVDWNIFNSDRFIINTLDGSLSRHSTGYTLAGIMDNRNMTRAGGYFDSVLAWNPVFGANRDIETGSWSGGLQGMLDEVYTLMEQRNYGAARRMYGAYAGEHLVYSDRGVLKSNDMLWSAVDGRRNANLDLNHGLNTFSARRSAASPTAYGDLVPPNCYPTRSRGRTVRDRNGGYSFAGGNSSVWAEYIGAWAKQNSRSHIDGYKTHANGIALGYEYRLGAFNFGGALSYARAHTKMSDYSQDTTTDAFNMALYADYNHSSGFYGRAGFGFSYGWNDYTARGANFHRSGDYKNLVWNLRGEIGYVIRTSAVNIIPSLGLRFSHYHQQGWTDKDKTFRGLHGDAQKRNDYAMDIPLEVRVNKVYGFGGVMVAPEAKVGIAYATKKNRPRLDYGLKGAPGHYSVYGVETGRTTGNLGLGVKAKFNPMVDAGLEYNFEFARKYRQHSLNLSVGVSF